MSSHDLPSRTEQLRAAYARFLTQQGWTQNESGLWSDPKVARSPQTSETAFIVAVDQSIAISAANFTESDIQVLAIGLGAFQKSVHATARAKGWWDQPKEHDGSRAAIVSVFGPDSAEVQFFDKLTERNVGEQIALMHSELSEALEGARHGNPPDDKVPQFSALEAEFADVIIRIFDTAEARGLNVIGAMFAKAAMNKCRAYKHGGKSF